MVITMSTQQITMPAGQFKARCLQLMNEVNEQRLEITITKHGKPVARLVPPELPKRRTPAELYGSMKGMVTILGDIEAPLDVVWDAER